MKYYIYNDLNGNLSILMPTISIDDGPDFTEEMAYQRAAKDVPIDATNVHTIEASDLPQDRTFRNAWKHDSGVVSHDIDKAKEVAKDILRQSRTPKLQKLDTDYMRADEAGNTNLKASIAQQKQALRDITKHPDILNAKTITKLKNVIQNLENN